LREILATGVPASLTGYEPAVQVGALVAALGVAAVLEG